jgi:hypothetical protein
MVQQYVSQLRRLLAEYGGPEIVTRGRGYDLEVDPAAVDALRFEQLVEQAATLDFSPDGLLLAIAGEYGRVRLRDAGTLAPAGRPAGLDPGGHVLPDGR